MQIRPNSNCGYDYCVNTADNATLYDTYICGDYRLGPVDLPTHLPLSTLFETYDRFGGLCPGQYLSTWTDISGRYVYPAFEGFSLNTGAAPIKGNVTLTVGMYVDRFGAEDVGYFVAPAGAPYIQRALPPMNLNTGADKRYPANYHVYVVQSPVAASIVGSMSFDVSGELYFLSLSMAEYLTFCLLAGPIAPWFGQTGQGTQYKLYDSVAYLLDNGYLRRVHRAEY